MCLFTGPLIITITQQHYLDDPTYFKKYMVALVSNIYDDVYGNATDLLGAGFPLPFKCDCGQKTDKIGSNIEVNSKNKLTIQRIFPPAFAHTSPKHGASFDCAWISFAGAVLTILFSLLSLVFTGKKKAQEINLSYLNRNAT